MCGKPISLGVRAIDAVLTAGEGQRIGLFAAAGGGKSTLLGMIARNTEADVNVITLVGERGREVRDFIEQDLGPEGVKRSVVVCATSNESSMVRLKAAYVGTAIAEVFSKQRAESNPDDGLGHALRTRPAGDRSGLWRAPSPRRIHTFGFCGVAQAPRAIRQLRQGMITAIYTVLVAGDDMNDQSPTRFVPIGRHYHFRVNWPPETTIPPSMSSKAPAGLWGRLQTRLTSGQPVLCAMRWPPTKRMKI